MALDAAPLEAGPDGAGSGAPCPAGASCNVSCDGGAVTSITGKVYDPAGRNGIYAVSTGSADTLECLLLRMGVSASEYVAGAGMSGHVRGARRRSAWARRGPGT